MNTRKMSAMDMSEIRRCLKYDPDTGDIRWIAAPSFRRPNVIGEKAGWVNKNGNTAYRFIRINNKPFTAHRIAWFLFYGEPPKGVIDHINRNGLDNRMINMRLTTHRGNMKNKRLYATNKSNVTGVRYSEIYGKWVAEIKAEGGSKHLYFGDDLFEACCQRKSAEIRYKFHENHGRNV